MPSIGEARLVFLGGIINEYSTHWIKTDSMVFFEPPVFVAVLICDDSVDLLQQVFQPAAQQGWLLFVPADSAGQPFTGS